MTTIGIRIKRERERRGWSPNDLAKALTDAGFKISRQGVSAWELDEDDPQHTAPRREAIQFLALVFTTDEHKVPASAERQAAMRHYLEFGPAKVASAPHLKEDAIDIATQYQAAPDEIKKLVQDALQIGAKSKTSRQKKGKKSQ